MTTTYVPPVEITFQPDPITHPAFTRRGEGSLYATVNYLSSRRFADSTESAYRSKVKLFMQFAHLHGLITVASGAPYGSYGSATPGPIDPPLLCYYLAWLHHRGTPSTWAAIQSYVTALVAWCKTRGRPDPRIDPGTGLTDMRYFAVCIGLKRKLGTPRVTRLPITLWHLDVLYDTAGELYPPLLCTNIRAATRLAFAAMLRVGEFTTNPSEQDPTRAARRGDVRFIPDITAPEFIQLTIRVSKTDQFRETCTVTVAKVADGNTTRCAVRALQKLFTDDPQPPTAPLFNFANDADRRSTTTSTASRARFTTLCNHIFQFAGIDHMHLKPHSFRQGGASALLAAGAPEWLIKTMGRWRSDCWTVYAFTDSTIIAKWAAEMYRPPAVQVNYHTNPPKRLCDY